MYKLYPYFTNDGSVGLFSPDADDIYHSTYGALTEAYEKFILPSNIKDFLKKNNEIKILDICFGIGYNSKSLISEILNFLYSDAIDTNNIMKTNNTICIDKKYTNNKKFKVYVHAIDNDKNLALLSPFFISKKNNNFFNIFNIFRGKNKLQFRNEKIENILSAGNFINSKYDLREETNAILLMSIFEQFNLNEIEPILSSKKYTQFFDPNLIGLYKFLCNSGNKMYSKSNIIAFLHNIYYKYISFSYKKALKALNLMDFNFYLDINDARQSVKNDSRLYNYIFLDAFTPAKCPCLWTIDFFKELYRLLDSNGMILTYSNSAAVRNAFFNAGFQVGKIFSESSGKFTGTIAVKNKKLIEHELSEYDLGLLKTKAGIFYRDENLTLDNEAIIKSHKIDVENSSLISSSQYIKHYKKGRENDL